MPLSPVQVELRLPTPLHHLHVTPPYPHIYCLLAYDRLPVIHQLHRQYVHPSDFTMEVDPGLSVGSPPSTEIFDT